MGHKRSGDKRFIVWTTSPLWSIILRFICSPLYLRYMFVSVFIRYPGYILMQMWQQYELHTGTTQKSVEYRAITVRSAFGQWLLMSVRQDYSTEQLNCLLKVVRFLPVRFRAGVQSLAYRALTVQLEQNLRAAASVGSPHAHTFMDAGIKKVVILIGC
jgi:hypothetical protein